MKSKEMRRNSVRYGAVGTLAAVLAACAPKPPPPPPPAPRIVIPPQPRPPLGAATNLTIPPLNAFGLRQTVNTGASPAQTLWNLRSAYNVAALNCLRPEHAGILEGYKAFLKSNAKRLTAANRQVDKEFREKQGKAAVRAREAYMTQVYNFYALPPTLPAFCDAALAMSQEASAVPSKELETFAANSLPRLDRVFLDFYNSYDQYRADLAAWHDKYAPTPPLIVPQPFGGVSPTPAASTAPSPLPTPGASPVAAASPSGTPGAQ